MRLLARLRPAAAIIARSDRLDVLLAAALATDAEVWRLRVAAHSSVSTRSSSRALSVMVPGVTTRTTLRSTGPLAVATSPTCSAMATASPSLISRAR